MKFHFNAVLGAAKKRGLVLVILIILALGVTAWIAAPPPELVYQGKPEHVWLQNLQQWLGDTNDPSFVAFRSMGSNALPELLAVAQKKRTWLQRLAISLNRKQSLVTFPGEHARENVSAMWALYAVGSNALPALPTLTNMLLHTWSTVALAGIGNPAVPSLLQALTNQDYRIRDAAATGLMWERACLDQVVPALVARLNDTNPSVRNEATIALGALGSCPEIAVPALTAACSNGNALSRSLTLVSLGQFETNASSAIPTIKTALNDPDAQVRSSAAFALQQINPDAQHHVK
jgi:hypothetical protein